MAVNDLDTYYLTYRYIKKDVGGSNINPLEI